MSKPSFIRVTFQPIKVCEANDFFYIKICLLQIKLTGDYNDNGDDDEDDKKCRSINKGVFLENIAAS